MVYKLNQNFDDMNKQNEENNPINISNILHFFCLKHNKFIINEENDADYFNQELIWI